MCIQFIYRHVRQIPRRQIFTTRNMLIYGTRSAVDSALSRMVKTGFITRLARGVFVRDASGKPSFMEIVKAKTEAFRVTAKNHVETLLYELKISPYDHQHTFARIGHTSSFLTIHGRAYVRGVSQKKLLLLKTKVGQIVAGLWFLKESFCSYSHVWSATRSLGRKEREEFWIHSMLMPAWLMHLCKDFFPDPKITTAYDFG